MRMNAGQRWSVAVLVLLSVMIPAGVVLREHPLTSLLVNWLTLGFWGFFFVWGTSGCLAPKGRRWIVALPACGAMLAFIIFAMPLFFGTTATSVFLEQEQSGLLETMRESTVREILARACVGAVAAAAFVIGGDMEFADAAAAKRDVAADHPGSR